MLCFAGTSESQRKRIKSRPTQIPAAKVVLWPLIVSFGPSPSIAAPCCSATTLRSMRFFRWSRSYGCVNALRRLHRLVVGAASQCSKLPPKKMSWVCRYAFCLCQCHTLFWQATRGLHEQICSRIPCIVSLEFLLWSVHAHLTREPVLSCRWREATRVLSLR